MAETEDKQPEDSTDSQSLGAPLSRRQTLGLLGAGGLGIGGLVSAQGSGINTKGWNNTTASDRNATQKTDTPDRASSPDITIVPNFVVDIDGESPPFAPLTPLYDGRTYDERTSADKDPIPVLTPDGRHVIWREYSAVGGSISVRCVEDGTRVEMHLRDLIPGAAYTIWNIIFEKPGFKPNASDPFEHLIGIGALGPSDGSQSAFHSSANGRGHISAITPEGPLSVEGEIGSCALEAFEWHVVGAYHLDGKTYGPSPGTRVEQFAFVFGGDTE